MTEIKNQLIKELYKFNFEPKIEELNTFKKKLYVKFYGTLYKIYMYALIIFDDKYGEWLCKLTFRYKQFELSKKFPIYRQNELQMDIFYYWYNHLLGIIKIIWNQLL